MPMTFSEFKGRIRALFGSGEDSSQTVEGLVGRATSRWVRYEWPHRGTLAAAGALSTWRGSFQHAQTVSLSASQPIAERTIYAAMQACKVKQVYFLPYISSTITNTASQSWSLQITKRKSGTTGSATGSYSLTFYVAGLTTDTGKQPTLSNSWSCLTYNVQTAWIGRPNKLHPATGPKSANLTLDMRDILTARVRKGPTANDGGAIFPGGVVMLEIEEM